MMHHHLRSKQSAAGHHDHHHEHHHKHHHKHHKHHHHEHGEGEGAAEEEAGAVADPEGVLSPQLRPRMTTSRWGDAEAGRPESGEGERPARGSLLVDTAARGSFGDRPSSRGSVTFDDRPASREATASFSDSFGFAGPEEEPAPRPQLRGIGAVSDPRLNLRLGTEQGLRDFDAQVAPLPAALSPIPHTPVERDEASAAGGKKLPELVLPEPEPEPELKVLPQPEPEPEGSEDGLPVDLRKAAHPRVGVHRAQYEMRKNKIEVATGNSGERQAFAGFELHVGGIDGKLEDERILEQIFSKIGEHEHDCLQASVLAGPLSHTDRSQTSFLLQGLCFIPTAVPQGRSLR